MNRTDSGPSTDDLPGFLDETSDPAVVAAAESDEAATGAAAPAPAELEPPARPATPAPTRARRDATSRRGPAAGHPRGGLAIAAGGALLLGAIGIGAMDPESSLLAGMVRFGISPQSLIVAGTVLVAAGATRSRIAAVHAQLDETTGHGQDLQESVRFLIDAQQTGADRAPAGSEDVQQLLVALQRQDEKLANLTKALKMYGKPMLEIAAQGTELAASVAQVRTAVDATLETSRQAFARVEAQLRSAGSTQPLEALRAAMDKLTLAVEEAATRPTPMPSLEPLQQQTARTEAAVRAVAERIDSSDVRAGLAKLDQATAQIHAGLSQLREGSLSGLETCLREVQREVATVATAIAQLQSATKHRADRPAAAPAEAAPAAAPAPAPTPSPGAPAPAAEATGAYQAGVRTSASKNVLGAIAKLKQMKS